MPTPANAPYKLLQRAKPRATIRYSKEQIKGPGFVFKFLADFFGYKYYGKHKARFRKWLPQNEAKINKYFPTNHPIWK